MSPTDRRIAVRSERKQIRREIEFLRDGNEGERRDRRGDSKGRVGGRGQGEREMAASKEKMFANEKKDGDRVDTREKRKVEQLTRNLFFVEESLLLVNVNADFE